MEITEDSLFEVLADQAEMETGNIKSIKEWREWLLEALSNSLDADQQELRNEIIKASPEDIYKELNEYRGLTTTKPGEVEEVVDKFNQIANTIKNKSVMTIESPVIGEVEFPYGFWGDLTKTNTGGFGIEHIIQGRHEKDNLSINEISTLLYLIQDIISKKDHYTLQNSGIYDRLIFEQNDIAVVVSKNWYSTEKNWIVTGFGKYDEEGKLTRAATDAIRSFNPHYSYALEHSFIREQVGAVVRSVDNIRQNMDFVNTNQEISRMPETQELSVEEINAYLEQYKMRYTDKGNVESSNEISYEIEYLFKNANLETKQEIKHFLNTAAGKMYEDLENLEPLLSDSERDMLKNLEEARDHFDEKFDKCMAEFRAKDKKEYASPKRDAVRDSESVGKRTVSKPVSKKI